MFVFNTSKTCLSRILQMYKSNLLIAISSAYVSTKPTIPIYYMFHNDNAR